MRPSAPRAQKGYHSADPCPFPIALPALLRRSRAAICCCGRRTLATTAAHEMSPVCAVVGGLLAQDILKALAAREPPIANFFTFDGGLGGGTVVRMGMP